MWRRKRIKTPRDIDPDQIFADSANHARFDTDQFEGKYEKSLSRRSGFIGLVAGIIVIVALYTGQAWNLAWRQGAVYAERAENNQLSNEVVFANRGLILDRTGKVLAGNASDPVFPYSARAYGSWRGIAAVVGYAKPPAQDSSGNYFRLYSEGQTGVEAAQDASLRGTNGERLTETDALQRIVSESATEPAEDGRDVRLTIDAEVNQALFDAIAAVAETSNFAGGAGIMMDANTGELIALVSYPEFSLQTMANGTNTPAIQGMLSNRQLPFLNRATLGLFVPGSVVKPYVGVGALMEGVIDEHTSILSTGSISVPNPYDPSRPSVFKDWKAHGWVDMRHAIAVSSDVYFYEVGGGYPGQKGLGISKLNKYFELFGFGSPTGIVGFAESKGTLANPAWKARTFPADPDWRLGNTYHTSIGQYGMQVTPVQLARAIAALVNGGTLLTPTVLASSTLPRSTIALDAHAASVVKEGMRMGVTQGVAGMLNFPYAKLAAKTGTAEVGAKNEFDNSNIEVFFPYDNPKYVLVIMMEKAPAPLAAGATNAAKSFVEWLRENKPEYLE